MSPTGIEPAHSVPETDALSTELRGLPKKNTTSVNQREGTKSEFDACSYKRKKSFKISSFTLESTNRNTYTILRSAHLQVSLDELYLARLWEFLMLRGRLYYAS